jgi:hypothetical protein
MSDSEIDPLINGLGSLGLTRRRAVYGSSDSINESDGDSESVCSENDTPFYKVIIDTITNERSKCYLRIFDGLVGDYTQQKWQMMRYNRYIPVFEFLRILRLAGLQVELGYAPASKFNNNKLFMVKESLHNRVTITVHEVEGNGIGHIKSKYYKYYRGPMNFQTLDTYKDSLIYLGFVNKNILVKIVEDLLA